MLFYTVAGQNNSRVDLLLPLFMKKRLGLVCQADKGHTGIEHLLGTN